jgi:simple sugar transport system permease protein
MMVEVKGKKTTFNDIVNKIGFPTIFIGGFWVLLLIAGGALGISVITLLSDTITFKTTEGFALLGSVFNAKWVIKFSPAIIKGIPMVA